MELSRTKAAYSGIYFKPVAHVSYELVNTGACKTGLGCPRVSSKGVINKGGSYTNTYTSRAGRNKTAER